MRLRSSLAAIVFCAVGTLAATSVAQTYPVKPIRFIVAAPPGGSLDFIARILVQDVGASMGQQLVIDNRGGAGGNIAAELAAKAAPDGYTIVLVGPSHVINPSLYKKLGYDALRDFTYITQIASGAYLLVVPASSPVKTIKDLVAYAQSRNGGVTYASPGAGQAGHLGMELLATLAKFNAVHVPYKGSGPAFVDVMAGRVDVFLSSASGALPHVRSGKVRAVAVTSLKRSSLVPEVPTVAESGFPGYEVIGIYGLLAPAGTPRDVVTRLNQEISRSLKRPDTRDRLVAGGADPVGSSPEAFQAYVTAEITKWAQVVRRSGASVD